jgi:hypothetical protein
VLRDAGHIVQSARRFEKNAVTIRWQLRSSDGTMDAAATLRLDLFGDCARWTANQHNAEYSFCAIVPADVLGEHCG